jgi:uncharacterized protein (TIGR03086 family)
MADLGTLVEYDRRALLLTIAAVETMADADLERPTPCVGWTVRDLLGHLIGQHRGFAASARGERSDLSVFANVELGPDPVTSYAKAAEDVTAAFAGLTPESGLWLPEIREGMLFPAPAAVSFHLVDYLVHGWDVVRALRTPEAAALDPMLDAELVDVGLRIARRVPTSPETRGAGKAFGPVLESPSENPADELLTLLGRSPSWPN